MITISLNKMYMYVYKKKFLYRFAIIGIVNCTTANLIRRGVSIYSLKGYAFDLKKIVFKNCLLYLEE